MTNIKSGHRFENWLCEELAKHGFWSHNLAMNASGQPADVIAIKSNFVALIDCKECRTTRPFPFSRVEDNQHLAMEMFAERTIGLGWFAVKTFSGQVFMIRYAEIKMCMEHGMKSFPQAELGEHGMTLERWLEVIG